MKIVINSTFGGYRVPDEVCKKLGCGTFDDGNQIRTSEEFIDWVGLHPMEEDDDDGYARNLDDYYPDNEGLVVVDVPDEATDFIIHEYDGKEWIDAVVDGKIVVIEG